MSEDLPGGRRYRHCGDNCSLERNRPAQRCMVDRRAALPAARVGPCGNRLLRLHRRGGRFDNAVAQGAARPLAGLP